MEDYSSNTERAAFGMGWDAHAKGEALDDNPFECITLRYEQWADGWRAREKKIGRDPLKKYPKGKPSGH